MCRARRPRAPRDRPSAAPARRPRARRTSRRVPARGSPAARRRPPRAPRRAGRTRRRPHGSRRARRASGAPGSRTGPRAGTRPPRAARRAPRSGPRAPRRPTWVHVAMRREHRARHEARRADVRDDGVRDPAPASTTTQSPPGALTTVQFVPKTGPRPRARPARGVPPVVVRGRRRRATRSVHEGEGSPRRGRRGCSGGRSAGFGRRRRYRTVTCVRQIHPPPGFSVPRLSRTDHGRTGVDRARRRGAGRRSWGVDEESRARAGASS